ncbi:MAG: type II secretion system protein [Selenomonadaceae bacterium]|nr:type II secretion system protein [Selenomonadaceae bacterium]
MNQRGFATLEVILMVMVIGILASIAVPRFNSITTSANTAKVQSDLSTLDTAAAIYAMENGTTKNTLSITDDLKDYLQDASTIKPPLGDVYVDSTDKKLTVTSSMSYSVTKQDDGEYRATLEGHTAGEFRKTS